MRRVIELQDRSAFIDGMKQALVIDPKKTVLLTVDMQREYLDREIGGSPVPPEDAERVLKHAKELLTFARQQGIPVVHVHVYRRMAEIEAGFFLSGSAYARVGREVRRSLSPNAPTRQLLDRVEGSPQSQVPAELVEPGDFDVTTKKTQDSYLDSDLDTLFQRVLKPETVVLTGINTDTCVYSSTFSTMNRGYQPVVISDCVATTRGEDHHQMALELMSRTIAWVLTVDEFKQKVLDGARAEVA
jgi:nicotinamidase-related amidase